MVVHSPPLSRRNSVSNEDPRQGGLNRRAPPPHPAQPGQSTQGAQGQSTQGNMDGEDPRKRATDEAKMAMMTACQAWEDNYADLDISEVPICMMKQKIEEVDEFKKVLQSHEPRLILAGPPTYPATMKEQVNAAKKGLSRLSRNMMKALAAYEEINRTAALNPPA